MGGSNEQTVPSTKKEDGKPAKLGKLRVHLSSTGGKQELHFHDDKLKVAVPVADWYAAWNKIKTQALPWQFLDANNGTLLTINPKLTKKKLDLEVSICQKLDPNFQKGDAYKALESFGR